MASINTLIRKASVLLRLSSQDSTSKVNLMDGEVVYCKNNVCVHTPVALRSEIDHYPGYLCIKAQNDEVLGTTLILSWIPNSTLKKNPRSLEKWTPGCSPCRSSYSSTCPSPTLGNGLSPRLKSGSQSPVNGSDKTLANGGFFYRYVDHERRSISSTVSDLGSPRDDVQSLDSWTTSDLGADTTTSEDRTSPSTPRIQPKDKDFCQSQTDSGIGPEEVTAALESMISGLNNIELSPEGKDDVSVGTNNENPLKEAHDGCDTNCVDNQINNEHELGNCISKSSSQSSAKYNSSAINVTNASSTHLCRAESSDTLDSSSYDIKCSSFERCYSTDTTSSRELSSDNRSYSETDTSSYSSIVCPKNGLICEMKVLLNGVEHVTSSQEDVYSNCSMIDRYENSHQKENLAGQRIKENSTVSTQDSNCGCCTPPYSVPRASLSHLKFFYVEGTPESVAHAHNLIFPEASFGNNCFSSSRAIARETSCGLFSVDLSQMRSLRLFFCDKEHTCGQLVIASRESQYKILHFHNGGLDKLATVFEEWSFLCKAKSKNENCPYRQFSVCRPEVSAAECHPEEGIYSPIDEISWREFFSEDGQIEDEFQLRKAIFFGGMDHGLRKEIWPFLLHHYGFKTTFSQREEIRNDRCTKYQAICEERKSMGEEEKDEFWKSVQCTVEKDVVRTDRSKLYFAGDDNPNLEIMKNILLNYAVYNPSIGYSQGMSDLLAPVLAEVQDESEAFWCFVGLMQRTIFFSSPKDTDMDTNLNYLQELLKIMLPDYYMYFSGVKDGLELLFAHRWILLCFKREFSENEALRMWESCWAHYQTDYFHLFLSLAIVSIYGEDVIQQRLRADEMLLHFSSLAMHMDGELVLTKARGLLHQFRLLPVVPCTVAKLCELCGPGMWDSGHVPIIECVGHQGEDPCLHMGQSIQLS